MNRIRNASTAVIIGAVMLAGCAHHRHEHGQRFGSVIHERPLVTIKSGYLSVSPEPLVFTRDQRDVRITWELPQGAAFPDNGIVIEGQVMDPTKRGEPLRPSMEALKVVGPVNREQQEIVGCARDKENPRAFSCLNRHTKPGVYRYTIRVVVDGKTVESDPTIMNE